MLNMRNTVFALSFLLIFSSLHADNTGAAGSGMSWTQCLGLAGAAVGCFLFGRALHEAVCNKHEKSQRRSLVKRNKNQARQYDDGDSRTTEEILQSVEILYKQYETAVCIARLKAASMHASDTQCIRQRGVGSESDHDGNDADDESECPLSRSVGGASNGTLLAASVDEGDVNLKNDNVPTASQVTSVTSARLQ